MNILKSQKQFNLSQLLAIVSPVWFNDYRVMRRLYWQCDSTC